MKKQLQLIIVAICLTGLTAYGQQEFTVDSTRYKITAPTEVEIVRYTGSTTEVTIEDSVTYLNIRYKVTAIGYRAFWEKDLTHVSIPNTVTSIGQDAFWKNGLTRVVIPESVTSLGQRAFGTNKLDSVTIPNGVTNIRQWVLAQNRLTGVTIPADVDSIGYQAFYGNNNLKLVTVERNVPPVLNANAFQSPGRNLIDLVVPAGTREAYLANGWTGFRSITFGSFTHNDIKYRITAVNPNEVEVIDYIGTATGVTIPPTVSYQDTDYNVTAIGAGAFSYNQLTEVIIPNSVVSIGYEAFRDNLLTEVTLPNTVTHIGGRTFMYNPTLETVTVEANDPPSLHSGAFRYPYRSQIDLIVPAGTGIREDYLANGWTGFISITFGIFTHNDIKYGITAVNPNEVEVIDYIGSATAVEIPETVDDKGETYAVTSIGNFAFEYNQLTEVTLPNSVTSIGDWAFYNNQLTSVTLPNSITSIGGRAFHYNPTLETVTVEANDPPSLHAGAFQDPSRSQIDLVVPAGTREDYLANGWTGFRSITFGIFTNNDIKYGITAVNPNEVEVIDYIGSATAVEIPETVDDKGETYAVTSIGNFAFEQHGLTSVTLPNSVTSIGSWAFAGNQLIGVTIPNSVTRIEWGAFLNNQLTNVTLPDSVTSIGGSAFRHNQLTGVTLPNSVTSIGDWAFRNNPDLATVVTKATVPPSLHASAFQDPGRNQIDVNVPKGKRQAYLDNGWTGFNSITEAAGVGDTFSAGHITYKVTSLAPLKVKATDYNTAGGPSVNIPPTVDDGPNTYTVTSIGYDAFRRNQLTNVTLPNSITSIGDGAFSVNQLTTVTLPNSVTSIGWETFRNNPDLTTVVTKATAPPSLHADAFQNADRNQIDLVVPKDALDVYNDQTNGWMGFKSITEVAKVGNTFSADHITYQVSSIDDDHTVFVKSYNTAGGPSVTIPPTVDHGPNTYTVTAIGYAAFEYNQLTEVTLPNSVTSIGYRAFRNNPNLTTVVTKATVPPSLHAIAFQNAGRNQIDVNVPYGKRQVYLDNGWTGFNSITEEVAGVGDTFSADHITYKVTSLAPYEVEATGYNTAGGAAVTIPPTVGHGPNTFTVTAIGNEAFLDNQLNSVIIPNSVTSIGWAAFGNIGIVVTRATVPPSLHADAFNSGRDYVYVYVPMGKEQDYLDNGWTGFLFLTEVFVEVGHTFSADHITYKVTSLAPYEVEATGYNTAGGPSVTIPPTVDDFPNTYTVTAIGTSAFEDKQLTSVILPNSVTRIGDWAFADNPLTSVTIGNSVTSIGYAAFEYSHLTEVILPNSVTSIGDGAFGFTPYLATVVTKATTPPSLHAEAFIFPYRNQRDLVVPAGTREDYLANGWTGFNSITEVHLWIGDTFSADHITYKVTSLAPYEVEVADYAITGGAAVTIPPTVDHGPNTYTVTAIGNEAFLDNQLNSVIIPNSVTSIGWAAFGNIGIVVTRATVPPSLHADAFNSGRDYVYVYVPMGKRQAYLDNGWTGFLFLTEVHPWVGDTFSADHITYKVTSLAPYEVEATGYNTAGGPSVTIPPTVDDFPNTYTVTAIGTSAFEDKQLTSVILPNSVTRIGDGAFDDNQLTSVTIPDGVTSIEDFVFQTNHLLHVTIPDGVTRIGYAAFEFNQLTEVTIPNSVTSIEPLAFAHNALTEVTIPNSVTRIGSNVFYWNPNLATVVTKATVPPLLDANAFYNADRYHIDLIVPAGTREDYLANGWTGFKSITEAAMAAQRSGAKASTEKSAEAPGHSNQGNEFNDFTLYPNPARDKVHIDIDPRPGQELKQVNIYTMTGTHLYSENGPEINTARLPSGTYLFEIVTKTGNRSMRRVIIQ